MDLNSQFLIDINAIENNSNKSNRHYTSYTSEYLEEDNIFQNKTKTSQIKNMQNEFYSSGIELFYQNNNDNDYEYDDAKSISKKFKTFNASTPDISNASSNFNLVAVGDWDCTDETEDTVNNILEQDPELVLALGDLSYNGKAKCWLQLIQPIEDKLKIAIGNHELDSSKKLRDYKEFFGLKEQYYSFNYKNVHFLALSTETDYDDESKQYQFAFKDLEKYSKETFIDWIIVFYHRHIYGSASLEEEEDFREVYHPLFDKYKVNLALQGHLHVYERTYPITFNDKDDDDPLIQDKHPTLYKNSNGTIFVTVGTGGAHEMSLSNRESFSAFGIDGDFGILNIDVENRYDDLKILKGNFIENGKDKDILDEFTIIKKSN